MQREASTSAFQACQGRIALILIPVKGQNGNCWFAIHAHHLAQQDLGPHREILKDYRANKYSLSFLFIAMKHLSSKGFGGLHPNHVAEVSYRESAPGLQCLKHLDWEDDKKWSSYQNDVFQPGDCGENGLADLAAPVVAV